jgi:DNA-binding response OmpR family regulator
MSGWEVCRAIRDDQEIAETGVLMLTGIGERLNEMTSPLYGADDHLDKPFDFEELEERVRALLAKKKR